MNNRVMAIVQMLRKLPQSLGQRGILLLAFAFTTLGYGFGLVAGYQPTFTSALGIPNFGFGLMFIIDGTLLTLGALLKWGRFPPAIAASVSFFWAFILTGFWAAPFGWVASMSWLGLGFVQLVCTIWPEPVTEVTPSVVKTYKQTLYIITSSELVTDDEDKDSEDDRPDEIPR